MRLILGSEDPNATPPPDDLWILFQSNGTFNLPAYIGMGYNTLDAYIVGGGGGGGSGEVGTGAPSAYTKDQYRGGGGGGGGGGGALVTRKGLVLSSLPTSIGVTIGAGGVGGTENSGSSGIGGAGTSGGNSIFNGVTAYGGGGGGGATWGIGLADGQGGAGGAGGNYKAKGANGQSAKNPGQTNPIPAPAYGGAGNAGGGDGGDGATPNSGASAGGNGGTATNSFGGGGGGGGGHGTTPGGVQAYANGKAGGDGDQSSGDTQNVTLATYPPPSSGYGPYWGGFGGGGGGGVNLTKITGYANLRGMGGGKFKGSYGTPGGGGTGGYGAGTATNSDRNNVAGNDGSPGCVLIRLYVV